MTAEVCGDIACSDAFDYELYDYESEVSWNGRLVTSDGKAFDKFGNLVQSDAPEAHIPLEEFIYRK